MRLCSQEAGIIIQRRRLFWPISSFKSFKSPETWNQTSVGKLLLAEAFTGVQFDYYQIDHNT